MNEVLNVLWSLGVLGIYLFICHLIAKRGQSTGLFYNRVFILALIFSLWVAIWVYAFRIPRRKGIHIVADDSVNKLPSFRDSTKFFAFQGPYAPNAPFKWFPPSKLLTPNGLRIVMDFREGAGEFLGGGVMKSKQLEAECEMSEQSRAIKARVMAQARFLSYEETARLSTQITSEWIALEYALLLSVTLYGRIIPIKWDRLESIAFRKKGFVGIESIATLTYTDSLGVKKIVEIQSGKPNMDSLAAIAKAVGI